MNQIVNMIIRIFLRRGIGLGINKAMDIMASKKETKPEGQKTKQPQIDTKQGTKNAKRSIRMLKRLGRF